jgi:hypothetical protein
LIVSYVHPLFLKAHLAASKADTPSWQKATRGKFAEEYWEAMKLEIATLENIDAWSVIDRYDSLQWSNASCYTQHLGIQVQRISRWME